MAVSDRHNTRLKSDEIKGVTPTTWMFRRETKSKRSNGASPFRIEAGGYTFEVKPRDHSLWVKVSGPAGPQVALRVGYCPDGEFLKCECRAEEQWAEFIVRAPSGVYCTRLEFPDLRQPMVHWTQRVMPAQDLLIPFWPRDLYPLGEKDDPLASRGQVHVRQRGPRSGLLYLTLLDPNPGSVLYFQNLTALNDYAEKTHTVLNDRVGGDWPELGYAPAPAEEKPLPANQEVTLSDAYVSFRAGKPRDECEAARLFLDLLAGVYLRLPRPEPEYHHWPDRVERTLRHLHHSPLCTVERHGRRFMNPYVGAEDKPPESMVQLSMLLPLIEFSDWSGRDIPLIKEIEANLPGFYDPELGTFVRWLVDEPFKDEQSEDHANAETMDSWYLYHTLVNLARLAQRGNASARKLFVGSLDFAVAVAHRFDYRWPVFFDLHTLKVVRAETAPGAGGENDVAGLYAWVMLLAWKLTGERRYFQEAERAVRSLQGLGFELAYQLNNTAMAAKAALQLWTETGDELFLRLSYLCLANILQHVWLWECDYGNAKYYHTFFGILPLKEAPYLALFEEFEVPSSIHQYLTQGGDDLSDSVRLLLAELCRYALDRAWFYYPSELPRDVVASKTKTGQIERVLEVPLEDLYEGWQQAGQVGQEVYGAGAPFAFITRHYHRLDGAPFLLYCDYPIADLKINTRRRTLSFRIRGDRRLACRVRFIPTAYQRLRPEQVAFCRSGRRQPDPGALTPEGHLEFNPRGADEIRVTWNGPLNDKARTIASRNGKNGSKPKTR